MPKCLACGFYNPEESRPEEQKCFQCGRPLDWDNVETEPEALRRPRARDWQGIASRDFNRLQGKWARNLVELGPLMASVTPFLLSLLLPGLGQLFNRTWRKAVIVFLIWMSTLIWCLHNAAGVEDAYRANWFLISTHIWAMVDGYLDGRRRQARGGRRPIPFWEPALVSVLAAPMVMGYTNAEMMLTQLDFRERVSLRVVEDDTPGLRVNDQLLVHASRFPIREDQIVEFKPNDSFVRGPHHLVGMMVGRVLATSGQHVVLRSGLLQVDGADVRGFQHQDLASEEMTVPPNQLLVWPILKLNGGLKSHLVKLSDVSRVAYRIAFPPQRRQALP